jgi:hypothetical protein
MQLTISSDLDPEVLVPFREVIILLVMRLDQPEKLNV